MNESEDNNIVNQARTLKTEILPSEPEKENHLAAEANGDDTEVLEALPERKPVKDILFIDDEEPVRKIFQEALEKFGYKVTLATNGNEGIKLFRENPADLVITDIFMPEKDGHALILELLQEFPEAKIFAITGKKSFEPQMELDIAETLGAKRVFAKPCKLSVLIEAIKEI